MNIYQKLTHDFNAGRLRAILSSGQAVVYHRLALASKDGDWIIREDQETLDHILKQLESRGAHYRLGAPLALPWLQGGWSCHFEFPHEGERIRTDFVSRPPRLSEESLAQLWVEAESADFPVLDVARLIEIKKTQRERDYPVIGELARVLPTPLEELLETQSPRDILLFRERLPGNVWDLAVERRPLLAEAEKGRIALAVALTLEREDAMLKDEARIEAYFKASELWRAAWPEIGLRVRELPLTEAHSLLLQAAEELLPHGISL